MIYVSSACSSQIKIVDAVQELVDNGFNHIELTGGTQYYSQYEQDLIKLKKKCHLNYLVHNYFPPPQKDIILNLASADDEVYQKSIRQLKRSIDLAHKLGSKRFGMHAGFLVDVSTSEIGKTFRKRKLNDYSHAVRRFCDGFNQIREYAPNMILYIENNVISDSNFHAFEFRNPFLNTTFDDFLSLRKMIEFNLLFDVAHTYISSRTLGLSFDLEFEKMFHISDYIHISDNDGYKDQNMHMNPLGDIFTILKKYDFKGKTITLEIYSGMSYLKETHDLFDELIRG